VPVVPVRLRRGRRRGPPGGIATYAAERLYEEAAYIAYHFHWPLDDLLDLEHAERRRWADQIAALNTRLQNGR
jgi:hypothetical protein